MAVHRLQLYNSTANHFCPNPLKLKNPLGLFPLPLAFPLAPEVPELGGGKNESGGGEAALSVTGEAAPPLPLPRFTLGAG